MTIVPEKKRLPRRRLLTLLAATAAMAGWRSGQAAASEPVFEWQGTALGARVKLLLVSGDEAKVRSAVERIIVEIDRLENVFSLYRPDSELCRLNRTGSLAGPSIELADLLAESMRLGELSNGAFDVTVQPLWTMYRNHYAASGHDPGGPTPAAIAAARSLVDYRLIDATLARVRFAKPDMAITLNGIAQGYITDRVADLLRQVGFDHVLVDLGEIRASGRPSPASGWPVRIAFPDFAGGHPEPLLLSDRAIATSAGAAAPFDASGRHHHIFDPATGASTCRFRAVSVITRRATLADGLSTALTVLPADGGAALVDRIGDIDAYWLTQSGALIRHSRPA
jgi:thiamine biosynthesis lipoprotein